MLEDGWVALVTRVFFDVSVKMKNSRTKSLYQRIVLSELEPNVSTVVVATDPRVFASAR